MNRTICYPFQGFHGAGLPPSNLTKVTWRGSLATLPSVVFFQSSLPTLIAFQGAFILRWETHSGSMWVFGRHAGKILHEFSATEVDMYVVLKQMKTLIKLLYMPTISHLFISSFPQLKTPCFLSPGENHRGGKVHRPRPGFPVTLPKLPSWLQALALCQNCCHGHQFYPINCVVDVLMIPPWTCDSSRSRLLDNVNVQPARLFLGCLREQMPKNHSCSFQVAAPDTHWSQEKPAGG